MRKKKIYLVSLLILLMIISVAVYCCNKIITDTARGKLYATIENMPFNKVGLLLGTSKFVSEGAENPYYVYRIKAAIKLLKTGKIKYIIISGDNSRADYNEPAMMRSDLQNAGIDSSVIFLDFAGFRTFDSVIRLKKIFGQHAVTIISQQFHNERAIYTASKEGISAIAFNATGIHGRQGLKMQVREKLARVKAVLDVWFGKKPKFLGERIIIPV